MSDSIESKTTLVDGPASSAAMSAANRLEVLVSALETVPEELATKMGLECDAVMVNQTDRESDRLFMVEDKNVKSAQNDLDVCCHMVHCIEMKERGVGLSRNTCIDNIDADKKIVLFSDDDIRYGKGYAKKIIDEFEAHPEADMILFNVNVCAERTTYHNDGWKRVRIYNSGRYPAYSIAVRTQKLIESGVRFSLLFGGGAQFSCGEDSLFFRDCLKAGLKIFASPVLIAGEEVRTSTWFNGYNEKFFTDKGVLYYYMYGHMAGAAAGFYLSRHKDTWCKSIKEDDALKLFKKGIKIGREIKAGEATAKKTDISGETTAKKTDISGEATAKKTDISGEATAAQADIYKDRDKDDDNGRREDGV